jgi:hypothetical protein
MDPNFPSSGSALMNQEGPANPLFRILNGKLLYHPMRNARFPYIYEIPTHAQVHAPQHIRKILIHVVDTSEKARIARANFDNSLLVPLGPNDLMIKYGQYIPTTILLALTFLNVITLGLFEMESGTILFARPLRTDGNYQEKDDIAEAWCLNGCVKLPLQSCSF